MFDPNDHKAAISHFEADAAARYPEEACGFITANGYVPMANLAADPREAFDMGEAGAQLIAGGEILALVHSHPDGPDAPSIEDQEQQLAMGLPWGLCAIYGGEVGPTWFWGDSVPSPPLLPRDFRWGPAGTDGRGDCLALVRDWYALHRGVRLPDGPRDPAWLRRDPELYRNGFFAAGFRPVNADSIEEGDVVLMAVQSGGKPNHAGIYLAGGFLLHHLENRMAVRESFAFWRGAAVGYLRYAPEAAA